MRAILAALFPQWRDPRAARDERLCREIVARGICAPTEDVGIAARYAPHSSERLARAVGGRASKKDLCRFAVTGTGSPRAMPERSRYAAGLSLFTFPEECGVMA